MKIESYVFDNGVERPMTDEDKKVIAKRFYQPVLQAYLDKEYGENLLKVNLAS